MLTVIIQIMWSCKTNLVLIRMLWSFTHQSGQKENVYQARNFCHFPLLSVQVFIPRKSSLLFLPWKSHLFLSSPPSCRHCATTFFFPPELLKSTEFAASSPSSFLLQSDLQTIVLLLFIKRFFLVFIILRIKFEYPQLLLKFIYIFLSSSVLFNGLF